MVIHKITIKNNSNSEPYSFIHIGDINEYVSYIEDLTNQKRNSIIEEFNSEYINATSISLGEFIDKYGDFISMHDFAKYLLSNK